MPTNDYEVQHFAARLEDGGADPRVEPFMRAVIRGFHGVDVTGREAQRAASNAVANNHELMLATRRPGPDPAFKEEPRATLSTYRGTVNVGAGILLPVAMVSEATVRPTDRRRGLLRLLMEQTLDQVSGQGAPLALLVASEGEIYGRYGYQPVYFAGTRQISAPKDFRLRPNLADRVKNSGTLEEVSLPWLIPHISAIYDSFHQRYRMSISRYQGFSEFLYWRPDRDECDPRFRAAIHLDRRGRMDGYVTFKIIQEGHLLVAKVRELVGANIDAELSLWQYVTDLDLVDRVDVVQQPEQSFLRYALTDPRAEQIHGVEDHLWARVLDPIAVLKSRAYSPAAREAQMGIRFKVDDEYGFATGIFEIQLDDAGASVNRVDSALSNLTVSAPALASLVFGSATVADLSAAGQIAGVTEDVADYMDALFAPVGLANCAGDF